MTDAVNPYSMLPSIRPVPVSDQQNFNLNFSRGRKNWRRTKYCEKVYYFTF